MSLDIELLPKQTMAYESAATEILYGGAAGGGKSFFMRAAAILWCSMIPGLQVYLFRRIYDDLVKNHIEGSKGVCCRIGSSERKRNRNERPPNVCCRIGSSEISLAHHGPSDIVCCRIGSSEKGA